MKILECFYNNGAFVVNDPDLISGYESVVKNITWPENGTTILDSESALIEEINTRIITKYLNAEFDDINFIYGSIRNGVEPGSTCWHSDENEGASFSALYCLSDLNNPGGEFEIRSDNTYSFKLKKYDLLIFPQKQGWLHRAIPYVGERITLNYGFTSMGY